MKKRLLSVLLAAVMVLSMVPMGTAAVDEPLAGGIVDDGYTGDMPEEEHGPQDICISLNEMGLVWDGEIMEGAQFPDGLSYAYDAQRDVHVLTMENMTMTEALNIDGWGESGEIPKVEIVLKGENVMDTRGQDYGEFHNLLNAWHADVTILNGEEGASLAFYGTDCGAICSHDGFVTIDGATITARCEIGENPEGGQCLNGSSDYRITGGAQLDLWAGWIGIIVSGAVTFEDCTVTTNRIHVHSHVEMDEEGNVLSTDQQTMTIGEGAVVNVTSDWDSGMDSPLMLLDGSILKVAGGTLNCNFAEGENLGVMVGYDGDCAVNTILIESGEMNLIGSREQDWQNLMNLDKGRLIQTGGTLNFRDGYFGLSIGNNSDARFEGGEATFDNCYVAIYHPEGVYGAPGDVLSLAGTDMTFEGGRFGIYLGGGRSSITGGNITMNIGPDEETEQAIYLDGKLVMSGGTVIVTSAGIGMLVNWGGDFLLQGGQMNLRSGDRGTLVTYGLVDLRGGELNLRGNSHTYAGLKDGRGMGGTLHLGENVFLRTEDATLVEEYDEFTDEFLTYYANSSGEPCIRVSLGTSGGVFSGVMDVAASELAVGVPFVVSADLALGEPSGTALFTLPDGISVRGCASVNGAAVSGVYDSEANTLTVPITVPGAAVRFYAVAERTMEEAVISAVVSAGEKSHELSSPAFLVDGLRIDLPATLATSSLSLMGSAAPGGEIRVYEVSDESAPVFLGSMTANALGDFKGSVEVPGYEGESTSYIYKIRVELWCAEELIDAVEEAVSYTSHAAKLESLEILNDYHGARLDEILTNNILLTNGAVFINGSESTKAYNYFPEYPTFFFRAEFEENHSEFCCPDEPERHIISARVEAKSRQGDVVSVPLRYNRETGTYDGYEDFPNWAPESFAVYWVEEGVVNRESVYSTAAEDMTTYGDSGWQFERILNDATEEVNRAMDEYLDSLQRTEKDGVIEYIDGEDWIFRIEKEELDYNSLDLSEGFVSLSDNHDMWVKTESSVDDFSASMTIAMAPAGAAPVALKQTVSINYLQAGTPAARSMIGASAEQRVAVFIGKQIPVVGDAVQAVDSKLLQDSLIEFDSQFSDDLARLTDAIMATMYYRCPYNGRQLPRGNTEEAIKILQELQQLRVDYNKDYQDNKDSIRDDMKESLVNGLSLGINKFANKRTRELYKELKEGWETLEEYMGYAEFLDALIQDPEGTLQETMNELMTPKGLINVGAELAEQNELIDEDTKELLNTLADPDGTYQDARDFMVEHRDKLTDLSDRYMRSLQKEIQGSGTSDDCKPPEPEDDDPPALPGEAGGEEIPVPAIKDPSGYVYEGVESNRLSGVKTMLYFSDSETAPEQDAGALGLEPYDMSIYSQSNPLYTDALGQYQWMVPDGWWQVKYEKDGYETCYSDWLPVPPPQTQVNVELVRLDQPQLSLRDGETRIYLSFDRYVKLEGLQIGLFAGDEENGYEEKLFTLLTPLNTSVAPDGETRLASEFELFYESGAPAYVQLRVDSATTYAGVELTEPMTRMVTINPSSPVVYSWDGEQCEVALSRELAEHILPFAASYQDGRMTQCITLTTQGVTLSGDEVQVFFLHADTYEPLCPQVLCEK